MSRWPLERVLFALAGSVTLASALLAALDRRWGDIITKCFKASPGPGEHVVTGPTAWHTDRPAQQIRLVRQKVDQAWGGRALFPGHIAGLVSLFPFFTLAVHSVVSPFVCRRI